MSLTNVAQQNPEKEKILEICTKLYTEDRRNQVLLAASSGEESYYCNRADMRLFESELFDYDFSTPVELKNMLQDMWNYQGHEHMKEFAATATIATIKNKGETLVQSEKGIPAFIYNF